MEFKHKIRFIKYFPIVLAFLFLLTLLSYSRWSPGRDIRDGRHDLGKNGLWLQHGWLGDDLWFINNRKRNKLAYFRNPEQIRRLALLLRQHHITDVFPHLCPTLQTGEIPAVDPRQTELFLDIFNGFRVMPWVGGIAGVNVFLDNPSWRHNFAQSINKLFSDHPGLSGIHLNIEPCPSGDSEFLLLLEEVRDVLPKGKILSVAAYPPPTLWHPFKDVHWDQKYFELVAQRVDQIVVMMYDTALRFQKVYQSLMASWSKEILHWARPTEVLLGVPTYKDQGTGYHDQRVENLENALLGVHAGLQSYKILPINYQGIAIYCEWEMEKNEWEFLREHFLKF